MWEMGERVDEWIAALRSEWSISRHRAAEALGQLGDVSAVEPLIAALRDEDQFVRDVSGKALGQIGDARAVEPLIAALGDNCATAVEALEKIAPDWRQCEAAKRQVPEFIAALGGGNWRVRQAAAEALGQIGDARALGPLIAALHCEDLLVGLAATEALGKFGVPAVKHLIAALRDKSHDIRRVAAEALGQIGDTLAVGPLILALRDNNSEVRWAAAEALGKIGPHWPQSEAAKRLVPDFIAALQDEDSSVSEAAKALGQIGDVRAVDPLIMALRDEDPDVRESAAEALGKIGDVRSVEPLITALRDEKGYVCGAVGKALRQIAPDWPQSEAAKRQVPEFIATLGDGNWRVRQAAAEALGQIGDARAVEPLMVALRDKDTAIYKAATTALDTLRTTNQPLLAAYPNLFCRHCRLRAEKRIINTGLMQNDTWVACRGCSSLVNLITGVEQVIGLIGGAGEDFQHTGTVVTLRLWNEADQTARHADIDRLVIRAGNVTNYERAVNAVINALRSDVSRPATWCKQIPVTLEGAPALSVGAIRMLEDTFGEVSAQA